MAQSLANGVSPFWTPNVFAGWPQIADPQSLIFSPPHLLLALLNADPSFWAVDALSFAMLFAGGVAILLLFRDRSWHPAGALVAALAFAFGGSAASRLQHTGQILSLAWFAVALWLLSRALERRSVWHGVSAGLAAGFLALGRDQVALLALLVLIGFVLAHWLQGPGLWRRLRESLAPLAAGGVAGALLIALPVAMTALLAMESNRPEIDFISAGRGSLHPAHFLTFVFSDLYGANDPAVDYWGPASFTWNPHGLFLAQNMGQLYLGAIPVVALLGLGLAGRNLWSREIRVFTVATVAMAIYALGWHTPAFRVMFEILPGVSLFRRPADASFLLSALLAILGGYFVHCWMSEPTLPERGVWITLASIAGALVTALWIAARSDALVTAARPIGIGAVSLLAALTVLMFARALSRAHALAAATMITGAIVLDLAWNNAPNESTGLPPATYDAMRLNTPNETIRLIKEKLSTNAADRRDRVELPGIGYYWPNISLIHGFDHLFGHNPLRLADFARATGVGDTIAAADQRGFSPLFPSYRSTMADMFGLRFIASRAPIAEIDRRLKPGDLIELGRIGETYVYENPRALPRVLIATDWLKADFGELIDTGDWPKFDPRQTVLLENDPGLSYHSTAGPTGQARIAHYGTATVIVEVDAAQGGFLVLNDVWHPWWRASVNGVPAPIHRANVLFRAVAVPAGASRIVFSFSPFAGAASQLISHFR